MVLDELHIQPDFQPSDEQIIEDLETLRVIADPLRLRIRELMIEPCTVKQVAAVLGMPATKLYYHVNLLEKHNLIVVVGARVVSGIIEKQYQVSANMVRVAGHLLSVQADEKPKGMEITLDALWKDVKADLLVSAQVGTLQTKDDTPAHQTAIIRSERFFLTPEQATRFYDELLALYKHYDELSLQQLRQADAQAYKLLTVIFPTSRKNPSLDE